MYCIEPVHCEAESHVNLESDSTQELTTLPDEKRGGVDEKQTSEEKTTDTPEVNTPQHVGRETMSISGPSGSIVATLGRSPSRTTPHGVTIKLLAAVDFINNAGHTVVSLPKLFRSY